MSELRHSVCQACQVHCKLYAVMDGERVTALHGDKDDPAYRGYSCIKGREMAEVHRLDSRLLHSQRRNPDGTFAAIALPDARREIAQRLATVIKEHGPRSVALFLGTYGYCNLPAQVYSLAFMRALGSPMIFSPQTIDQPGKGIAMGLHGLWMAGNPPMAQWDALLLIGTNPLISMNGGLGPNPAYALKQARKRGMKLIVIDPRTTESAAQADLHIQSKPGEDAAILAGIVREMLRRNLIDHAFVAAETDGLERLAAAVEPFDPDHVAQRAGIDAAQIAAAAEILGQARRGAASAGTGANMSGTSAVNEYFVRVITTLRGWWLRAGEKRPNPGVLIDPLPSIAASPGPTPAWGIGETLRVRGLRGTNMNLPTAALADEILMPGEGQIKALLIVGGNPVAGWPDQFKTDAAMQALDLLVCFDPRMNQTCRRADYVIAPKMQLEVETNSAHNEMCGTMGLAGWGYEQPYGIACPPVTSPPVGSDLEEEWETFYGIAREMGLVLSIRSAAILDPERGAREETVLDMVSKPSVQEVWRHVLKGSPIPYDEVRAKPEGRLFEREDIVQAKPADWTGKLDIGSLAIMEDLAGLAAHADDGADEYPFRLLSRRMNDFHNSNWQDSPRQRRRFHYNPAFMHPDDLAAMGAADGDVLAIASARARILGVAASDPGLRRGCVSMAHAWGGNPDDAGEDPFVHGASTARLCFTDRDFDRYSGIPLMSAIPVSVALAEKMPTEGSASVSGA